jgi:hypothetical protein
MIRHTNFFKISAKDNFDLGLQLGGHFRTQIQNKLNAIVRDEAWSQEVKRSKEYLAASEKVFPQYVREIEGYAKGAGVAFDELWARSLGDELSMYRDHCTSIVTNKGKLVAHNEDWDVDAAQEVSILQKTIGGVTIFELYYFSTLGGNSVSINSHGYVQMVNSLTHSDWQMGVSRKAVTRFLSETSDPDKDIAYLSNIKSSSGFNHILVNTSGQVWNLECTSKLLEVMRPPLPFVHTNHYLSELSQFEAVEPTSSTFNRFDTAASLVASEMTEEIAEQLMSDISEGNEFSVFNERTIGRMTIDLDRKVAKIWLRRESEKGWIEYPLTFLRSNE